MAITRGDVEKIAHLARLQVSESQIDKLTGDLSNILSLVDELQAVDTTGILPMSHPLDAQQRLRADIITEENHRDEFQRIAPATENGLYLVPKVIE
ncbi:MAG: Asp-tRNA(Asn)/Glu-tRNA(Gln) amidotransferase subunit GatC [Hahellaceae bacterium]|nr:Asp-tRNA(Asn)/Glu-tRNA(Gln) amidotransferase subunit GatC [Hahellaceae bacterium]MCP5169022.1 Asp-tRNA(Asn)/Glu-tRNA(Gln) amidotransferase subunit GatC [Hahellaceae bacterium]